MNNSHHNGIILKKQFEAVQLEMELRSNVEIGKVGKLRRKIENIVQRKVNRSEKSLKKEEVNANKEK